MKFYLTLLLLVLPFINPIRACTIFTANSAGNVLVGNNEDYNDQNVSIRFYPASKGQYGRMLLKIDKNEIPFGGMNEKGLFFDWCALPRRDDIVFPSNLKQYSGILCEKLIEECASLDEAIGLYRTYRDPWLYEGHIMIVDKTGASAVIEWGKDSLAVIRREDRFQVCTNFNLTDPKLAGWYPCWRYTKASQLLGSSDGYSVGMFSNILNSVHQGGENPTIYSTVYELDKGIVHLFELHNYSKQIIINLNEELAKGKRFYKLFGIFCELKTNYPEDCQQIGDSSTNIDWSGNGERYELYVSKSKEFENCIPIPINHRKDNGYINPVLILILLGAAIIRFVKSNSTVIFISIISIFLVIACNNEAFFEPIEKNAVIGESYRLSNLENNTTYYWKVISINDQGFRTISKTISFTVCNDGKN